MGIEGLVSSSFVLQLSRKILLKMFSNNSLINPAMWPNGPAPGCFFNFPGNATTPTTNGGIITRTQQPITTGTSILGVAFEGGVMLAGDMLGSYGSLAKFRSIERIIKVNDTTILGASGDIADFQYLKSLIEQRVINDECDDNGFGLKPKALHTWLTRMMYNRRSKFDPLWNTFLVAGLEDGEPYLGCVDKIGTTFRDSKIATGYGAHIALPLMREALEKKPQMTKEEVRALLMNCLRVLYFRDTRALNKHQIVTVTAEGVEIENNLKLDTNWEVAKFVSGYE